MKVRLIAQTQSLVQHPVERRMLTGDELIGYIARVSNPANQLNVETVPRLLAYCMLHGHWSIFEQAGMTVEIVTSRAISAQIIRHRSFCFQEFSQRYAKVPKMEEVQLRTQDTKNRQGSGSAFEGDVPWKGSQANALVLVASAMDYSVEVYKALIESGVSRETARMVLPLASETTLYMTGSVRSWLHYFEQRRSPHAQKEHQMVAEEVHKIFVSVYPLVAEAMSLRNR